MVALPLFLRPRPTPVAPRRVTGNHEGAHIPTIERQDHFDDCYNDTQKNTFSQGADPVPFSPWVDVIPRPNECPKRYVSSYERVGVYVRDGRVAAE